MAIDANNDQTYITSGWYVLPFLLFYSFSSFYLGLLVDFNTKTKKISIYLIIRLDDPSILSMLYYYNKIALYIR
jgi:hypothetical protein